MRAERPAGLSSYAKDDLMERKRGLGGDLKQAPGDGGFLKEGGYGGGDA